MGKPVQALVWKRDKFSARVDRWRPLLTGGRRRPARSRPGASATPCGA